MEAAEDNDLGQPIIIVGVFKNVAGRSERFTRVLSRSKQSIQATIDIKTVDVQ